MTAWVKGKPKGYRTPAIDRLMAKVVENEDGCWIWQGGHNGIGYGVIGIGGEHGPKAYVHRLTYEHFVADIPDGLVLDHLCRNPPCCNPWHVEPVTQRVNLLRGEGISARAAAATSCVNGHAFTQENTYVRPKTGHRSCRECARQYQSRLRAQRRQA